jgi:hypothetical protein
MYNKFQKTNTKNKFGSNKINSAGLTADMKAGFVTAIPIWELLNITEEKYNELYKTKIIEQKDEK